MLLIVWLAISGVVSLSVYAKEQLLISISPVEHAVESSPSSINQLYEQADVEVSFVVMPIERAQNELRKHNIDGVYRIPKHIAESDPGFLPISTTERELTLFLQCTPHVPCARSVLFMEQVVVIGPSVLQYYLKEKGAKASLRQIEEVHMLQEMLAYDRHQYAIVLGDKEPFITSSTTTRFVPLEKMIFVHALGSQHAKLHKTIEARLSR